MRVIAATLLVLVLGARSAPGQGSQCMYSNQYFSSGSISCQNGKQHRCVAGAWQPSGLDCADSKADADQPGLDVDPSRGAPGIRQPVPPAVPQD
jgi:hypothetical protein